jgi:hypothetical protein
MGKKSDLYPEFQKFVKMLSAFFSKEKATKKPIVSFDRVYQIRVITKLPNSEQSYKEKVKTHNHINRQNQSTTGKL